ncbi:MAG TPA: gliding motility-associated C-terminal domain-containing protein, partial [Luteibaculaceae bacterium]|nr:gliding motility-associated C-terminal domain-containing protein [Luteibaculaceae bacterium]
GSSSALQFTFSGIGPFTAEVSDGTSNTTYNALSATDSKLVTPGQTTDYMLVRIRDRYCDNTSPNGIAQRVTVNAAPTLYPATLTRVCNNTATAYTLTMEFDGGDPNSYAAVPASLGSISQAANGRYVYTSTPISNNTNFSVAIDDANACGPVTITDNYTCPCITQAGTLNNNLVQACDGSPLTIPAQTGAVLDANDAVQYVVHTNPGNPLASAVKTVNSNTIPQFGLNLGQTYFVTAIYGNDLGGGTVNSSDACFVFSNSSRIRFNALPTATMSGNNTICQFQSTPLNFNFTGAAPFTVTYDTVNQVTPTVATLAGTTGSVSVSPLDSTIYRLISVVDNNGCSNAAVGQVLISVNVAPVVRIVTNDTTICSGALQVNAVLQGTPPFNFTFNYGSTTDVRTGYTQLTFGRTIPGITMPTVCTITGVSDGNCPGPPSNTITITPVALPTGTIATPAAICDGIGFPVDLTLTGLAPFSVTVNQNGRDTTVTVPGNTFSFPASYSRGNNTYRLGRIIASGDPVNKIPSCRTNNANRSSVTLVNDLPSASISGLRNICKGETSFISINTSIGAAPIQVNYQDNFGNTFTEQMTLGTTDVTHTPTNSGDNHYTITGITDNNGCIGIGTGQATISVYDSPTVAFNVINNTGCTPVTATIIPNVTVTGGFTGTWNFGNGQTSTQPGNQTQTYGAPGSYTISYDVISQFGCKGTYSLPNAVQVQGYPTAAFTYAPDKPTVVKNIVDFQNLSSIDATAFEWRFGDGDSAFVIHPTHTYPDTEAVYVAQLKAFTSFGCADSVTNRIAIGPEMQVFVPTSFSPNGDGSNDLFFPVITDNSTEGRNAYEFRIYNRWGQLVFETYDHTQGWDGRFNGELVKPDTYVWVMKIRPKGSGDAKFYEGQVTIIR